MITACTRSTQRCADAREYTAELRACCRSHVVQIMGDLSRVLTDAGIVWWADYGTLLGAVRNPLTAWADYPWLEQSGRTTGGPAAGIIPHDKDGDVGVLYSDWSKYWNARKALGALGYNATLNGTRASSKVRLSARNHTNVDVFFWRKRGDGTMYRNTYAKVDACKGREFPWELLFPLSTVEWEGMTLPAPRDPEAFLEMRYGPNWRTPVAANNDGVLR